MTTDETLSLEQVARQVCYWLELADYDLDTGRAMLATQRFLYVTFMCHQVVEKALKGIYVSRCLKMPPRIHALVALAQRIGVLGEMTPTQQEFLEALDPMNIECRYPAEREKLLAALTVSSCQAMLIETETMLAWIKQQLSNESNNMRKR